MKIIDALIDAGYVKTMGASCFSSVIIGGVQHLWENGEKKVSVGLNEYGYPPTLSHPRPTIKKSRIYTDENGKEVKFISHYVMRDPEVIGWIQRNTIKEIQAFLENPHKYPIQ